MIFFAVVLDRREDKNCETGRYELAFKQVNVPHYSLFSFVLWTIVALSLELSLMSQVLSIHGHLFL